MARGQVSRSGVGPQIPPPVAGVGGAPLGLGPGRPVPSAPAAATMWCLHCNSERTQSLLELELDCG